MLALDAQRGTYFVKTQREESGLHNQDKYPYRQICLEI